MARIRTLKPEFFRSRSLARCSLPARFTFQGLWCEADDHGRGIADPRILKGSIWPLEDECTWQDVEKHLGELEETGHIHRYEVGGDEFYEIPSWADHQSAAYRRGKAMYPAPDGTIPDDDSCTTHDESCKEVQDARSSVLEGKGKEGKGKERAADAAPYADEFDAWWQNYPRKVGKAAARKAFTARRRDGVALRELERARDAYTRSRRGEDPKFTLHGATFLAPDGRWTEYLEGVPKEEARNPLIPAEVGRCAVCGKLDLDCSGHGEAP